MNLGGETMRGRLGTSVCDEDLRALRANRVFGMDKRRIRPKNTVMDNSNSGLG
jgi:hypothetical protein